MTDTDVLIRHWARSLFTTSMGCTPAWSAPSWLA